MFTIIKNAFIKYSTDTNILKSNNNVNLEG